MQPAKCRSSPRIADVDRPPASATWRPFWSAFGEGAWCSRSGRSLGRLCSVAIGDARVFLGRGWAFLVQQRADEDVPFFHRGALLGHVVPAVVALRADVLERVVLQPVANFLREAGLSRERLPGAAQVPVGHDWDDLAVALTRHEWVERAVADGLGWVGCRGEKPAMCVGLDGLDQLRCDFGAGNGVRLAVLGL